MNPSTNGSSTTHRDPRLLTTLPEILSCLSEFQSEEAELSNSLSALLKDQEPIVVALERLQALTPQFDEIIVDAQKLKAKVSITAGTAKRVGSRVRSLDDEMGRVREASEHVGQVMDLKSSLAALQAAMESRDWESAATHCAKAMGVPLSVTTGQFAEIAVPTAEMHLPPAQTLQNAREELLDIFRRNFEEASKARDSNATSRFFKLFPAIGWEEEGLEIYAQFVVELVRERAPSTLKASSPFYYIAALTALFESIAMIIDQHEPVVTKYYGSGKMTLVAARLLEECDRVTTKLKASWEEERAMQRKLQDAIVSMPGTRKQQFANVEENMIDHREVDKVLSELAGMIGRWHLFKRFLYDTFRDENQTEGTTQVDITSSTKSNTLFEELVTNYYLPLEVWYTQITLNKAHKLATADFTETPIMTTVPDDAFTILQAVIVRLLSTGSLTAVQRTVQQLKDIIDRDFIGVIKRKMDDVYKNAGPPQSNARQDKQDRENRANFIVLLNDLDISASHLDRLVYDLVESNSVTQHFREEEYEDVKKALTSLAQLSSRFSSSIRAGVEQLFNQLLRPKLRNLIPEVYKDASYLLNDDGQGISAYHGLPRKRFVKAWESLIDGYKDTFAEANFRLFIGLAVDAVIKPWEKQVTSMKYTEMGALAFEHDLRGMTAYLTGLTTFGDIKDKFVRLRQISDLLNLGSDEDVDDYYNTSGERWRVGPHEARAIAALKV